jgi:hypothetical protein
MEVYERIVNIEKQKQLYTVPPTLIKKYISNYGHTDKSLVQRDVIGHKSIVFQKDNSDMTHHESDAIAGAYAFVMGFLASDI